MAPILKEADSSLATATNAAPSSPIAKSPTETPTRPQPVAIEIPVTINGARTVDGSDKREPFSESTLTVLVFAHGAVVRVSTPVAPGQLIFLTNGKSKKEVVCQVIKSKSGGSTGAYVELQFTEPAPGFWGLWMPSGSAVSVAVPPASSLPAPVAPKSVSPVPPAAPKPVTPAPFAAAPSTPATLPPSRPRLAPPSPLAATSEPVVAPPVAAEPSVAPVSAGPPPPVANLTEPEPPSVQTVSRESVIPLPPAIPAIPLAPLVPVMLAPLGDYSKEIEALFATPPAAAHESAPKKADEAKSVPDSSAHSSEELKLQAARLQAQLSSLLFTDTPAASPAASTPPVPSIADSPLAEVTKKVVEIARKDPAPAPKLDSKPAPLTPKPVASLLPVDGEVKIPAWLAPLSQSSDTAVAPAPSSEESSSVSVSESSDDSCESVNTTRDSSPHAEASVFGGHLLGGSTVRQDQVAAAGSRKGIFISLAAAAVLLMAAGYWYSRPNRPATPRSASARSLNVTSSDTQGQAPSLPPAKSSSSPSLMVTNPSLKISSPFTPQPTRSIERISSPPLVAASPEPRNSESAPRNAAPAESARKSALGQVRLAAPVVNRGALSDSNAVLPAIDTNLSTSGADALAAEAAGHRKEPAAPVAIGGDVKPAQLVKSVPPLYPAIAKTQRISGTVQLDALVDESGNVAAVKAVSGPPLLRPAAVDAVKQWKYTPATLDGKPTTMHLTVTVQFRTQ